MKKIMFFALTLVFIFFGNTIAASAHWSEGVGGAENNTINSITIGGGRQAETQLNLKRQSSGGYLIPQDITPRAGEVNFVTLTVNVVWEDAVNSETIGDATDAFGELRAVCASIKIGAAELLGVTGKNGEPLFEVSLNNGGVYDIFGNDSFGVEVIATVVMNRPVDKAQYDLIANQTIFITLHFSVIVL